MTGWDVLGEIMSSFPPIAATVVLVGAAVVFIVGFARHGNSFLKHGFKQMAVVSSLERRFDSMESKLSSEIDSLRTEVKSEIDGLRTEVKSEIDGLRTEVKSEIDGLRTEVNGLRTEVNGLRTEVTDLRTEVDGIKTEVSTIKTNHFGHLKSYLGVLNGVLLDKRVIDNETKARLDNEIRGM